MKPHYNRAPVERRVRQTETKMLIEYFKRITEKFPTEDGKRHCIVYDSEMECLKIGVWLKDQMMTFQIETEDEFNDLEQLISDVENLMRPWTHAALPNK